MNSYTCAFTSDFVNRAIALGLPNNRKSIARWAMEKQKNLRRTATGQFDCLAQGATVREYRAARRLGTDAKTYLKFMRDSAPLRTLP